jgi:hypothetical protein
VRREQYRLCVENGNLTLQCPCRNRLGDPRVARRRPRRVHLWHYTGMTHLGDALAKFVLWLAPVPAAPPPPSSIELTGCWRQYCALRFRTTPWRIPGTVSTSEYLLGTTSDLLEALCCGRGASVRRASATSWEDAGTALHCHRCWGRPRLDGLLDRKALRPCIVNGPGVLSHGPEWHTGRVAL